MTNKAVARLVLTLARERGTSPANLDVMFRSLRTWGCELPRLTGAEALELAIDFPWSAGEISLAFGSIDESASVARS